MSDATKKGSRPKRVTIPLPPPLKASIQKEATANRRTFTAQVLVDLEARYRGPAPHAQ
jgi:hypothetical protein